MKTDKTVILLAGIFMLTSAVPALAQEKDMEKARVKAQEKKQEMTRERTREMTQAQEDKEVEKAADEINSAAKGDAEKVRARIMTQYGVDEARVRTMRDEGGMNYGEISLALSLARGMEGGINDENIARITALRQGEPKMGWGRIAQELGQKLGPAISESKRMSAELRKEARENKGGKEGKKDKEMKKEKAREKAREMREQGAGKGGGAPKGGKGGR
jgi:hypothetical protein